MIIKIKTAQDISLIISHSLSSKVWKVSDKKKKMFLKAKAITVFYFNIFKMTYFCAY